MLLMYGLRDEICVKNNDNSILDWEKKDFFGYNKNFLITMHRNFYEEWNWKPDKHNVLNTYFWQFKVFFR